MYPCRHSAQGLQSNEDVVAKRPKRLLRIVGRGSLLARDQGHATEASHGRGCVRLNGGPKLRELGEDVVEQFPRRRWVLEIDPGRADTRSVSVDLYHHPRLRRPLLILFVAEDRLRVALRRLRRVGGWDVALVVFALLAVVVRSWTTVLLLSLLIALKAAMWLAEERRFGLSGISETDSLSGEEFEDWLYRFFVKCGFEVEQTPYRRDFGADFILTWSGMRTAVQAKSGHTRIGVNAVQQVVGAKAFYGCERAMVVTNQYFTEQAVSLADAKVVLRSRDDLVRKMAALNAEAERDSGALAP
jgi:HJR/Mrr/RecB family endonuclease